MLRHETTRAYVTHGRGTARFTTFPEVIGREQEMNDRTFDYSEDVADEDAPIVLSASLQERLVATVQRRHPQKSYGYLISDVDARTPTDFILFEGNIRNSDAWKDKFEYYGRYFVEHDDAGF